jgi:hypothetical protein
MELVDGLNIRVIDVNTYKDGSRNKINTIFVARR